jgi:DNA replication protein DnaC
MILAATWNTFIWMRDRKLFQNSILHVERLVRKAQQEAGYALLEQRQVGDSKALQEAVQNTEEILSALCIGDNRSLKKLKSNTIKFTAPPQNPSFVGRVERIKEIHDYLRPSENTNQSGRKRSIVLCGLGGVGKTQLALEYAHRYKACYGACFWITCDSAVKSAEGFAEIARVLELGDCGVLQNLGNVKDWLQGTGRVVHDTSKACGLRG